MATLCNECWGTGWARCSLDRQGRVVQGFCHCPLGRAMDREFEAASMAVCPVCGRPNVAGGCETCAAMAEGIDELYQGCDHPRTVHIHQSNGESYYHCPDCPNLSY